MEQKQELRPLALWLQKQHKSTAWLARNMEVSYQTAWSWAGGMSHPNLSNAMKLKKLTGLSLEVLTQ